MKIVKQMRRAAALCASALLFSACASNMLGPENQLELVNESGTFAWQATALESVTQALSYTWSNPSTQANVNQSSSLSSGSASVRITDATGTEVYNRSLTQNGTQQTSSGQSGSWTITVTINGASGAINFRAETP